MSENLFVKLCSLVLIFLIFTVGSTTIVLASDPAIRFEKKYDKNYSMDSASEVIQADGYFLVGQTQENHDIWLVRTDVSGNALWNKTYGGSGYESGISLISTNDNGLAIVGSTDSSGAGGDDGWFIKTDSAGVPQWNETYGGYSDDILVGILQESDGGYVLLGNTESLGAGLTDCWLIRTDENGNELWNKTYGGLNFEASCAIVHTTDGGYAFGGTTQSFGAGGIDFWLVKLDINGNMQWNKTFGSAQDDVLGDLILTNDGGFVLAGYYYPNSGETDIRLIKTDNSGNLEWSEIYGESGYAETVNSLVELSDGALILAGRNWSYPAHYGSLLKIGSNRVVIWTRTFAGPWDSDMASIITTDDQGVAAAGYSMGSGYDFWLVKTDSLGMVPEFPSSLVLSIFLMVTVAAALASKKKIKRALSS